MEHENKTTGSLPTGQFAQPSSRQIAMIGQRIDSRQLFAEGREITIQHGQDSYRLRLTAQNKLILTK